MNVKDWLQHFHFSEWEATVQLIFFCFKYTTKPISRIFNQIMFFYSDNGTQLTENGIKFTNSEVIIIK